MWARLTGRSWKLACGMFFPSSDVQHCKQDSVLTNASVVQSLSHVGLFATPWTAACQAPLFSTISWRLLKFVSIGSVMPSNHLILCHPLLSPSILPSIRVFSNESVLRIRPKYWSLSFRISTSNEYSGLISQRMDWLDLLAVQGTLKSPFSNTTVQKHQFFGTQPSLWSTLTSVHNDWKKP